MNTLPADTVVMTPRETRLLAFDFSKSPEIKGGESISSFAAYHPSGPTVGAPALNAAPFDGIPAGQAVVVAVSGVSAGSTYPLSCTATTSGGATLEVAARVVGASAGT